MYGNVSLLLLVYFYVTALYFESRDVDDTIYGGSGVIKTASHFLSYKQAIQKYVWRQKEAWIGHLLGVMECVLAWYIAKTRASFASTEFFLRIEIKPERLQNLSRRHVIATFKVGSFALDQYKLTEAAMASQF